MASHHVKGLVAVGVFLFPVTGMAGDFFSPSSAKLTGDFRSERLALETNRFNLDLRGGSGSGGAGALYDEYQDLGLYQNVIWVNVDNVAENSPVNITVGESSQGAEGSNLNGSNTVAGCIQPVLNAPSRCGAD